MKQLPDKKTINTQFGCDFCKKILVREKRMEWHENICYFNPNRDCPNCDNTGTIFIHALGANLGVIPDADSRECDNCRISEKCGGKSYIEKV